MKSAKSMNGFISTRISDMLLIVFAELFDVVMKHLLDHYKIAYSIQMYRDIELREKKSCISRSFALNRVYLCSVDNSNNISSAIIIHKIIIAFDQNMKRIRELKKKGL